MPNYDRADQLIEEGKYCLIYNNLIENDDKEFCVYLEKIVIFFLHQQNSCDNLLNNYQYSFLQIPYQYFNQSQQGTTESSIKQIFHQLLILVFLFLLIMQTQSKECHTYVIYIILLTTSLFMGWITYSKNFLYSFDNQSYQNGQCYFTMSQIITCGDNQQISNQQNNKWNSVCPNLMKSQCDQAQLSIFMLIFSNIILTSYFGIILLIWIFSFCQRAQSDSKIKIKCVLLISTLLLSGTTLLLFIGAYQINQLSDNHLEIKMNPQLTAIYIASAIINLFDIFVGIYIGCNYENMNIKNNSRKMIDKNKTRKEQREQISQLNTQQSNFHKPTDQTLDIYPIHGLEIGQYDLPQLKLKIKTCIPPNQEVEI